MDEELQKRNTDCVYFLASPLTCKKGVECEYRHSETARLNPRDCWYWMSGSCLNPTCAFRHPPLDICPETASEPTVPNQPTAASVNKMNVPCYFYFNGFCNKGERCTYLHGPEETAHTWKSSKGASAAVDVPSSEKKTSNDSVFGETQSFEIVPKSAAGMKIGPEKDLHQPPSNNIVERHASQLEEVAAIRSNSAILEETFVHSRSQESTGLSSGEQKLDPVEREEWLESSPGFDVLVDGSEDFVCEDDAYILHHDAEAQEHYGQLSGYDYEDNVEQDPAYPDLRNSFDREVHDGYRHVDDEDMNSITTFSFRGNERIPDRTLQRKRTLYQEELDSEGRSGVDLRDYLKKRRVIDDRYPTYSEIRERPCTVSGGHLRGRLGSKVEVYSTGSRIDTYNPARSRHSIVSSSRHNLKQRRPAERRDNFSEISRKIASRRPKSDEESTLFSGPKSLAQIKEEKRKALENGNYSDDGTGS